MYKRKRAGNTITRKINSTKDTAAKADKNHYISNSYLEGFIPIDTEYFTASNKTNIKDADDTYYCTLPITCTQSSRGDFLSPLTPPYMPFGIRRFNITSKHGAHCNSQDSLQALL